LKALAELVARLVPGNAARGKPRVPA